MLMPIPPCLGTAMSWPGKGAVRACPLAVMPTSPGATIPDRHTAALERSSVLVERTCGKRLARWTGLVSDLHRARDTWNDPPIALHEVAPFLASVATPTLVHGGQRRRRRRGGQAWRAT